MKQDKQDFEQRQKNLQFLLVKFLSLDDSPVKINKEEKKSMLEWREWWEHTYLAELHLQSHPVATTVRHFLETFRDVHNQRVAIAEDIRREFESMNKDFKLTAANEQIRALQSGQAGKARGPAPAAAEPPAAEPIKIEEPSVDAQEEDDGDADEQ